MPQALTYPGVYVEEVPSGVRTIAGVATSIGLFIGWAPQGSDEKAGRVFSFADYERNYGGLDGRSLLGYAVRHFFDNGGADAYIMRLGARSSTARAVPATATPRRSTDFTFEASSPGRVGARLQCKITQARRAPRSLQDRRAARRRRVVESFENLSIDAADPRFVESDINDRSRILQGQRPCRPARRTTTTATLSPAARIGDVLDPGDGRCRARSCSTLFDDGESADKIDLFNIVCVPGLTDGATIETLAEKCAARRAFLIVDCPEGSTRDSVDERARST